MAKRKYHKFRKKKPNWGRTKKARDNMSWALWRIRKKKRGEGVLVWPPIVDDLLVWLRGDSDETQKLDTEATNIIQNFTMSGSHCVSLNGVDEYGTTTTNHGTIVSYEGTATPSYDGTTLSSTAGTLYNITFSDGTHFRIAEGSGLTSWDDTGIHYISWTADEDELWAQRQDTYHGNAVGGYGKRSNSIKFSQDMTQTGWGVGRSSIINVSETSPAGDAIVSKQLDSTDDNTHYLARTVVDGLTIGTAMYSVYAKAAEHSSIAVAVRDNTSLNRQASFDLVSDRVFNVDPAILDTFREEVGGGWVRCSVLISLDAGGALDNRICFTYPVNGNDEISFIGTGNDGVLVWGGQLNHNVTEPQPYIKTEDFILTGQEYLPFLNDNKGNTFNDCETSYAPEEFPVGSPNGVDDEILLPFDVPADATMTYGGTCTATLDIANNKITMTAGTIRNIEIQGTTSTAMQDGSAASMQDGSAAIMQDN